MITATAGPNASSCMVPLPPAAVSASPNENFPTVALAATISGSATKKITSVPTTAAT